MQDSIKNKVIIYRHKKYFNIIPVDFICKTDHCRRVPKSMFGISKANLIPELLRHAVITTYEQHYAIFYGHPVFESELVLSYILSRPDA